MPMLSRRLLESFLAFTDHGVQARQDAVSIGIARINREGSAQLLDRVVELLEVRIRDAQAE